MASLGDILRHLRKKSIPTKFPWEAARTSFLCSCCKVLAWICKIPIVNLVFLKNCSMLALKFEIIIQSRRALIGVYYFFSTQEQEHATVSLKYKTEFTSKILWNSDQNFWSKSDLKFAFCNHSLLPFLKSRCCFKYLFVFNILNLHYLSFKMSYH